MEIIIGTTAINRPELHSDNIEEWYEWINSVDKDKYNINWFINVDYIDKLDYSVEETIENFQGIIKDIPTHYLKSNENKGNFLQACKRISSNIESFIKDNDLNEDNIIIIWLEDDWKLNKNNIPLEQLLDNYLGKLTYINLSFIRANYIHALAPSIIHWNLWKKLHLAAWNIQDKHVDPEHCVGLYFIKNFCKYVNILNITIINKNINEDYFNQEFISREKSFYTYHNQKYNIFENDKYIYKNDIIEFSENTITFVRISPSFCLDGGNYGRSFMEKYNIKKNTVQNDEQISYYS